MSQESVNPILESLKSNPVTVELTKPDGKAGNLSAMEEALLMAAAFESDRKTRIIVKKNKYEAQQLYSRLAMLEQEVLLFVMDESLRLQAIAASPEEKNAQVNALYQMTQDFPKLIITNTAAFTRFLPDAEYFKNSCITLKTGQEISRHELSEKLLRMGYAKVNYAEQPCSFAMRGGILDVYSLNYADPIRIEFFDTEIDSIRFFNPQTQRTVRSTEEVTLIPAADVLFTDEQIQTITENVRKKLPEELKKIEPAGQDLLEEAVEEDLRAIESYDPQARLYRYFSWVPSATVLDYCDGEVVFSPAEDVEEFAKQIVKDNASYMQEEVQDFQALPHYMMFHDLHKLEQKNKPFRISRFQPFDLDEESGIQTLDAPGLNYLEWVPQEAAKDNVFFALEKEIWICSLRKWISLIFI